MSRQLADIVARRRLLVQRCAFERLELRAAIAEVRAISPLRAAVHAFAAPSPARNRLLQILLIAIGSTRLQRTAKWIARGVLLWRIWSVFSLLRAERRGASARPPAGAAASAVTNAPAAVQPGTDGGAALGAGSAAAAPSAGSAGS